MSNHDRKPVPPLDPRAATLALVDSGVPVEWALSLHDLRWDDLPDDWRAALLKTQLWVRARVAMRLQSRFETMTDGSALRALEMLTEMRRGTDRNIVAATAREKTLRDFTLDDPTLLEDLIEYAKQSGQIDRN